MNRTAPTPEMVEHVRQLRESIIALDLSRPDWFDALSVEELARVYNGYGPDDWPAPIRAAITHIYEGWEELAVIHDEDYDHSDGTRRGWYEATARWGVNISLMLDARYPLCKFWLWRKRAGAWAKLRASYRALQAGSWGAWEEAYTRRASPRRV